MVKYKHLGRNSPLKWSKQIEISRFKTSWQSQTVPENVNPATETDMVNTLSLGGPTCDWSDWGQIEVSLFQFSPLLWAQSLRLSSFCPPSRWLSENEYYNHSNGRIDAIYSVRCGGTQGRIEIGKCTWRAFLSASRILGPPPPPPPLEESTGRFSSSWEMFLEFWWEQVKCVAPWEGCIPETANLCRVCAMLRKLWRPKGNCPRWIEIDWEIKLH